MSKVLSPPTWLDKWSRIVGVLFVAAALSLFLPWRQFAPGEGQVVGLDPNDRFQELHAPVSGFIQRWYVREGSFVRKGDRLVTLSDTDVSLVDRLAAEERAAQRSVEAAELALETGKINLHRQRQLFEEGLAARKDWEKERISVSKLEMELAKARAELLKVQSGVSRQSTQTIVAPRDGQVVRVRHGEGGQVVKQGDALLVLAPVVGKMAVEMWVDANAATLVKEGNPARLEFAGWPAIQIPGWPSLALGTFPAKVSLVDAVASKGGKFRVLLVPDGEWPSATFLRQGVRASGFLVMDQVTLGWEIWRHFNGFPLGAELAADEATRLIQGDDK